MTSNKKITPYNTEAICPLCGSVNIDTIDQFNENGYHYYRNECLDCGATWNEEYELVFTENNNIKDKEGNEYISVQEANRLIEQGN